MADSHKIVPINQLTNVDDNLVNGIARLEQKVLSGDFEFIAFAALVDENTYELGLLGDLTKNPLALEKIIQQLHKLAKREVKSVTQEKIA